jgi:hypothetical protein
MHSASRAPRSAPRQPTPVIAHGLAEKRSGYSENPTARTAHFRRGQDDDQPPRRRRTAWPTFAHGWPVLRLVPEVGQRPQGALGPTRANVARAPTTAPIPPGGRYSRKVAPADGPWEQAPG